jgi:hypothetical protein
VRVRVWMQRKCDSLRVCPAVGRFIFFLFLFFF